MTDKEVIEFLLNKEQYNNFIHTTSSHKYDDINNYLNNRYKDSESRKESIYRLLNNIEVRPICPMCGNKVSFRSNGYSKYCSRKCSGSSEESINKGKRTCLKRYGVDSYWKRDDNKEKMRQLISSDEIQNKIKRTNNERYGVDFKPQLNEMRIKLSYITSSNEVQEKIKKTKLEKYGDKKYVNYGKAKQTCLEKYGCESWSASNIGKETLSYILSSDEVQQKSINTKKHNHSTNTSKPEEEIELLLRQKFPDLDPQHHDNLYPFNCDFYIPSLKIYIEYNGHWTHGDHPYNENDINDINKLNKWRKKLPNNFYKTAIKVWVKKDPMKRSIAKKNNLNYVELWSLEEAKEFIDKL